MDSKNDIKECMKKIEKINEFKGNVNIMEVCGTHTMAISKFGIRNILSNNINLISGPGCPVCVTPDMYIDYVYELSLNTDFIIATYGDMIRVPGSKPIYNLENAKAKGANVKMVYSSMDALNLCSENPDKKIVFLGIGFETTAPATAIVLKEARKRKLTNFYVLSLHKKVEPVMRALLEDKSLKLDGFLCPGHVAVIIGEQGFKFLEEYNCAASIAGFEMNEVIDGIYDIIKSIENRDYTIKNAYSRLVRKNGNITAAQIISETFDVKDDYWRGIGLIPNSGFKLKKEYEEYDIENLFPIKIPYEIKKNGCMCGEVLKGKIKPTECGLFGKVCSPDNPVGPCMVSGEGSCSAYYKYRF